jgi:hypothetical protein
MSSYVTADLRRLVMARAQGVCEYCLIHQNDTFWGCEVEHIISEKRRGKTIETNLAWACAFCNRLKGTDVATFSPDTGELCRLFNPRTDRWRDHFRLDGPRIEGLSEIGRATVLLLRMNGDDRLLERTVLVRSGRYPCASAKRMMERM